VTKTETTLIRNAAWVIAWEASSARHVYRQNIDVAFSGNAITHVGPGYDGAASRVVEGGSIMVMPGLVNIHAHPASEPLDKGFNEELRSPRLGMSGLYEYMPLIRADAEGARICAEVAYSELLLSGVTTLVDLSVAWEGWLDVFAASGLRGGVAPMFRSARWFTPNGYSVEYQWDEAAGRGSLDDAIDLMERAERHPCGRLFGVMSPSQVDTCTPELLEASLAAARQRRWPLTIHAAQSLVEFQEMTRRHGMTPIQWLHRLGFLSAETTIAHCIFADHHSWIRWHGNEDLEILAETGVSVAHCPNVFVRGGILLESFGRYRDAGVNIGIGTDTYPHNMLDEIRWAAILSRVADRHVHSAPTADVLHAATVGGANALGRDDIGRIATGAKADLLLVDLAQPAMQPCRDPLRSLVYSAQDRAVRDVYVDGRLVVENAEVLTLDYQGASAKITAAQDRAMMQAPALDWAKRPMDEISPLSLPLDGSAPGNNQSTKTQR